MLGLTAEERVFWDENGFLVLRNVLSDDNVDEMLALVERQWREREDNDHAVDILSGEHAGATFRLSEIDPRYKSEVYKLNNLFGRFPDVRRICYNSRVKAVLRDLLAGEPLICNSLNFERGSQQGFHVDTWYMPPPIDDMMVAASFVFEDVDEENGPLTFYPGSHRIPAYRFSTGRLNMVDAEAAPCVAHLESGIAALQLAPEIFKGRKGDVFLWHAQLLHGGRPITDFTRTRNSMVVHYWREQDIDPELVRKDGSGVYLGKTLRGEIAF